MNLLMGWGVKAETFADWKFQSNPSFLEGKTLTSLHLLEKDGKVTTVETDTALGSVAQFEGSTYLSTDESFVWAYQDFSVEVLFKADDLSDENVSTLVGQWDSEQEMRGWFLGLKAGKVLVLFDKPNGRAFNYYAQKITEGKVYYLAMVKEGAQLTVYSKNITDDEKMEKTVLRHLPTRLDFASLPLSIGATSSPSSFFKGLIGRVKIHTEAIAPVQLLWGN